MRTIVLAVALAAISSAAMAEWVALDGNDDSMLYADPATIRRSGDMVKMWSMFDYETTKTRVPGKSMMSMKTQNEYDCRKERSRVLYFTAYSGNMGSGTVMHTLDEPGKWMPISPGTFGELDWKFACGKK